MDCLVRGFQLKCERTKKIEYILKKSLGKTEQARNYFSEAWSFIKRIEAAGVKLKGNNIEDELFMEEFSHSLAQTVGRICNAHRKDEIFNSNYDGVLLLVDEADNSSQDLQLGTFLKLLTERLQRLECNNFMVGLAGLPDLRNVLHASHPSSLRVFNELPMGRLTDPEVEKVVGQALEKANKDNDVDTIINEEGLSALVNLAEGYPHFIQQFGSSAFEADTDNIIDKEDVENGAFGNRGAMEKIGDSYYRSDFYNKIQKESYRQVLRIMADNLDGWVSKKDIKKQFKGNEGILANAIKALRDSDLFLS